MRICIVSNYKKNGYGESTRPYYLSINLLQQGHEILHLCNYEGFDEGIHYIKIDPSVWEKNLLKRLMKFLSLAYKVKAFNPDVIYLHQFNTAQWGTATKIFSGIPLVFDAHTSVYFEGATFAGVTDFDYLRQIKNNERKVCSRATHIICASIETREILKANYELRSSKLSVVNNATNLEPLKITETQGVFVNHSFTCVATIPFDGFFSNNLALNYLFEIAAEIARRTDKIRFVVIGGGEKPPAPTSNIIYAGYVPDLRSEILAADICLMPYPNQAVCGGARNKFCDFIALGKVVISSPEGMRGMQILENGKNCLIADNKLDYADKIMTLFQTPSKIKAIENEVIKITDQFKWSDRAKEVDGIFKALLS